MASVIKPPILSPGDTIAVAAPASAFDRRLFSRGVERLREAGYRVIFGEDIFARESYFAGADERRAAELVSFFRDPEVRAIFCARGGYGSQRILPLLDRDIIRRNPTILMGYSDITALHCFLGAACGMVSFHGPLVTEFGEMPTEALKTLLSPLADPHPWGRLPAGPLDVLRGGSAEGTLTGGSLSLVAAMLGTPYRPRTAGAIIFLEDRGEKPYAVDRLLWQLKLAGAFDAARGVILGRFVPPREWSGGPASYEKEIRRIALDVLGCYRFPILANFPAGHAAGSICFPLGVRAAIDGAKGTVTIVEPCLI